MDNQYFSSKQRKEWMKLLAVSDTVSIESAAESIPDNIRYSYVVEPETGMIMIQARADGRRSRFNLGEISITRCIIEINKKFMGAAWVMGSDLRHAELAAKLDGLLQDPDYHERIQKEVIEKLQTVYEKQIKERQEDIRDTTVEFFTMKRGE